MAETTIAVDNALFVLLKLRVRVVVVFVVANVPNRGRGGFMLTIGRRRPGKLERQDEH